jgi:ribonuclease Z
VDLLYHESTFLNDHEERAKKTFHSTAAQAGKIAKAAGVSQLLLGHYSARYTNTEGFLMQAQTEFSACLLAFDGKKIKI